MHYRTINRTHTTKYLLSYTGTSPRKSHQKSKCGSNLSGFANKKQNERMRVLTTEVFWKVVASDKAACYMPKKQI